jgi:hypothetical protein
MVVVSYSIVGHWWLFHQWLLVVCLLMAIVGYPIGGYWWLFFVILSYITSIGGYYIINYCWIF